MQVHKRDGHFELFDVEKIRLRIKSLCGGHIETRNFHKLSVDLDLVVEKVAKGACDKIKTSEIDGLSAEMCAGMCTVHPDYGVLAARIAQSNHHKLNPQKFSVKMKLLHRAGRISDETYQIIAKNASTYDNHIQYTRDYKVNFFGFKTLQNAYLLSCDEVVECPQDMFMRVAIGIHAENVKNALETYDLMSLQKLIHATPTLFNAGTNMPQLSSCFLLNMVEDSIYGIYETLSRCATISKNSGGIGVHVSKIRARGSLIRSSGGSTNGIVPMLKVYEATAKYVDQGGNKRLGSFAVYLEPWHDDVFEFLDLRKNTGKEEHRARDLFLSLWIPDLFMNRVKRNDDWTLFCPDEIKMTLTEYKQKVLKLDQADNENCDGNKMQTFGQKQREVNKTLENKTHVNLYDLYGDEFYELYAYLEKTGKGRRTVPAQLLWKAIIDAQIETGNPYMLYKDSCNRKNNQANLGTLTGSNLCCEILEYTDENEVAVCNLASIALPSFIKKVDAREQETKKTKSDDKSDDDGSIGFASSTLHEQYVISDTQNSIASSQSTFKQYNETFETSNGTFMYDFDELRKVAGVITKNLNCIINGTRYPLEQGKTSNLRHRPIGIGVQGLADVFAVLRMPFESKEALRLNAKIFEVIYYGALESSCKIAKKEGTYESFEGSPISKGLLQFDLWKNAELTLDWSMLRSEIEKHGVRNSLLVAPMPTATTSQILGFNECFEPFTSNIYTRRTLAGDFQIVNRHLLEDLMKLDLWSYDMKNAIIQNDGSIQNIDKIPQHIRDLYKTAWEMKMKSIIDLAAARSPFVDQSMSLNLFMPEPTYSKLSSMHFYAFDKGLKTGMYYLRTKPITRAFQFTVDKKAAQKINEGATCTMQDGCLSCSG